MIKTDWIKLKDGGGKGRDDKESANRTHDYDVRLLRNVTFIYFRHNYAFFRHRSNI